MGERIRAGEKRSFHDFAVFNLVGGLTFTLIPFIFLIYDYYFKDSTKQAADSFANNQNQLNPMVGYFILSISLIVGLFCLAGMLIASIVIDDRGISYQNSFGKKSRPIPWDQMKKARHSLAQGSSDLVIESQPETFEIGLDHTGFWEIWREIRERARLLTDYPSKAKAVAAPRSDDLKPSISGIGSYGYSFPWDSVLIGLIAGGILILGSTANNVVAPYDLLLRVAGIGLALTVVLLSWIKGNVTGVTIESDRVIVKNWLGLTAIDVPWSNVTGVVFASVTSSRTFGRYQVFRHYRILTLSGSATFNSDIGAFDDCLRTLFNHIPVDALWAVIGSDVKGGVK